MNSGVWISRLVTHKKTKIGGGIVVEVLVVVRPDLQKLTFGIVGSALFRRNIPHITQPTES